MTIVLCFVGFLAVELFDCMPLSKQQCGNVDSRHKKKVGSKYMPVHACWLGRAQARRDCQIGGGRGG